MATEPYIDAHHLAAAMGVSTRTVKRWTAQGMPSEQWGMRVRRYLLSRCVAWARERGHTALDDQGRRVTTAGPR